MSLEQDLQNLGPWFHTFIINGISTKPNIENQWTANYPDNLWQMIKPLIPFDLKGKKVLDIGCDAGYLSFEMAKMGASVTAVDIQQGVSVGKQKFHRPLDQARYLENNVFKLGVNFIEQNFLDLKDSDYDFILFCGVYYHMPDHKLAFPKIRSLLKHGGVVITESAVGHVSRFYTGQGDDVYHDDPTNYFVPSQEYILKDLLDNKILNCNWGKYLFDSRILITSVKAIN
jgi:2-polyprenyl-3-methyl-5-hydroxy-6-metoxy-1,4-benzoquinol methylase